VTRRRHDWRPYAVAGVALLLAACSSGGASGGGHPTGGTEGGLGQSDVGDSSFSAPCAYPPAQPIGLNDMTPLGVTAAQLLAYAGGTHLATLTWGLGTPGQDVTVTPTGTTTLTIDVTPMAGGVTLSEPEGGLLCGPGTLAIAASVRFTTADDGFDETWQTSLFSSDGQSLEFTEDLEKNPPTGTFRVVYTGTQTWTSTSTLLTATFDDRGARGNVQYATEEMFSTGPNGGGGGGLIVQAATWAPLASDGGSESGAAEAAGQPDAQPD
jgi:hypothetical protein